MGMNEKRFFNKTIIPQCKYCKNGQILGNGDEVFCLKKGIMSASDGCRGYKYDVLKREPKIKTIADGYKAEDFEL